MSPVRPQLKQSNERNAQIVLKALLMDNLNISALMKITGEKNKNRFRKGVLYPLIEAEWIEQTIKDKPNSSKQGYKLTDKAKKEIEGTNESPT